MQKLGLKPGASLDRLTCASSLAEAVREAESVQESAPERLDRKRAPLAQLAAATLPESLFVEGNA
jgi:carnitine 3-dehydrogenase